MTAAVSSGLAPDFGAGLLGHAHSAILSAARRKAVAEEDATGAAKSPLAMVSQPIGPVRVRVAGVVLPRPTCCLSLPARLHLPASFQILTESSNPGPENSALSLFALWGIFVPRKWAIGLRLEKPRRPTPAGTPTSNGRLLGLLLRFDTDDLAADADARRDQTSKPASFLWDHMTRAAMPDGFVGASAHRARGGTDKGQSCPARAGRN
jgi:hypothetical protein